MRAFSATICDHVQSKVQLSKAMHGVLCDIMAFLFLFSYTALSL